MYQMNLTFVPPDDPILLKTAKIVSDTEIANKKYQELIESMLQFARGLQDPTKKGLVGLAAPQVGYCVKIILVDLLADGKINLGGDLRVYLNPEITWFSDDREEWYEGCFSTDHVRGIVNRPAKVKVKYLGLDGTAQIEELAGYTARIFQHEVDHLNGKEFITHITDKNKLHWVNDEEVKEYRNNQAWRNCPHKATFEQWYKIKGIKK